MRVVQLPDVDAVRITCDGEEFTAWRAAGPNAIELDLTIGDHALVVRTGYHGGTRGDPGEPASARCRRPRSSPAPVAAAAERLGGRAKPGRGRRGCTQLSLLLRQVPCAATVRRLCEVQHAKYIKDNLAC